MNKKEAKRRVFWVLWRSMTEEWDALQEIAEEELGDTEANYRRLKDAWEDVADELFRRGREPVQKEEE